MKIFDWYVLRNLAGSVVFISITLAVIIFLTQSLRFLELVIASGASSSSFWILTFLTLPRFFEIILPLAMMAATVFIYNRMTMDSEVVAIRSVGHSPAALARPAIVLAVFITIFLWAMAMWVAPKSLSSMHQMRQIIKAQFSTLLLREGVFNQVGNGLTVYVRERTPEGELRGVMIHDSREEAKNPSTILAKRGILTLQDDGHQVVVYEGSRQEYDPDKKILQRLNFERYTIDLPESGPVRKRWREPEERTIIELLNPNARNERDIENLHEFRIEIHKRITAPLMAISFALIACCVLLLGPVNRHGQAGRITVAVLSVVALEALFLAAFNFSRQSVWGIVLMYVLVFGPLLSCAFLLSGFGEKFRRSTLFRKAGQA